MTVLEGGVTRPSRTPTRQPKPSTSSGHARPVKHIETLQHVSTVDSNNPSASSSDSAKARPPNLKSEKFTSLVRGDRRRRLDTPPPLPFDLRDHKVSISIFTLLALAECCFLPIGLYYGLIYGSSLRIGKFVTY